MHITRRMALTGLAASIVPIGALSIADRLSDLPISVADRCHALAAELSELLAELDAGAYEIAVRPRVVAGVPDYRFNLLSEHACHRRDRALGQALAAMNEINPGSWRIEFDADERFALIIKGSSDLRSEVA